MCTPLDLISPLLDMFIFVYVMDFAYGFMDISLLLFIMLEIIKSMQRKLRKTFSTISTKDLCERSINQYLGFITFLVNNLLTIIDLIYSRTTKKNHEHPT